VQSAPAPFRPTLTAFLIWFQGEKFQCQLRWAACFIPLTVAETPQASDPLYLKQSLSPAHVKQTWRKHGLQPSQNTCPLPLQCPDKDSQRAGPSSGKLKTSVERSQGHCVFIPSFLPNKHTEELLKALCQHMYLWIIKKLCFLSR